ncbi:hypothetical protein [Brevibacillus brevis]|uniref:hypothetical protein n=1 Tax=Brevibacillus brevis TaxID=1393 RepID=UPI001643E6ED|nr:hypothetical protein [Brevibacillus brevis]
MKKVVASLLSLSLVLSASVSALAAEPVKISKSSQKAASANDPYEPNDDPAFAPYINSNVSYTAQISHNRDADYYNFYAKPGEIKFALSKLSSDSKQLDITIQKPGGQKVKSTYTKGNTSFTAHIPEEGQYYIFIVHSDGFFDPTPISAIPYTFKAIFNQ